MNWTEADYAALVARRRGLGDGPAMMARLANELPGKAEPKVIPAAAGIDHGADIAQALTFAGIPFVQEVRFHPTRKWLIDFSLCHEENLRIALERQGGHWKRDGKGRHSYGRGFENDCEKLTELSLAGWLILLVPSSKVAEMKWLERAEFAIALRRMGAK